MSAAARYQFAAYRFGGMALFDGLGIAVRRGEIVAIVGPSGCGKTMIGNILLRLVAPDHGEVRLAPGIATAPLPEALPGPTGRLRAASGLTTESRRLAEGCVGSPGIRPRPACSASAWAWSYSTGVPTRCP